MVEALMWVTVGVGLSALTSSLYVLMRHRRLTVPDERDGLERLRGEVDQAQTRLAEAEHALDGAKRELDALSGGRA